MKLFGKEIEIGTIGCSVSCLILFVIPFIFLIVDTISSNKKNATNDNINKYEEIVLTPFEEKCLNNIYREMIEWDHQERMRMVKNELFDDIAYVNTDYDKWIKHAKTKLSFICIDNDSITIDSLAKKLWVSYYFDPSSGIELTFCDWYSIFQDDSLKSEYFKHVKRLDNKIKYSIHTIRSYYYKEYDEDDEDDEDE